MRYKIRLVLAWLCICQVGIAQSIAWQQLTITRVHLLMQRHQLSCQQLVAHYLERIRRYDLSLQAGAPLNAIVAINPAVLDSARRLDQQFADSGQLQGALHCIPIIVKDNIATTHTPSTSGTLVMLGSQPNQNATLVNRLQRAGAIIIGKAGMDELASGMAGMSGRSGRIGNAYDPLQSPGGSSAGTAVAVSAGFALVGIGTDNSGSVRIPAAFNGLTGIRPTAGLISRQGIFPRGNLDGVAGVMARDVGDVTRVLAVLAKRADPHDPLSQTLQRGYQPPQQYLQVNALAGKRIGVVEQVADINPYDVSDPATLALFAQAKQHLKQAGAMLVAVKLPGFNSQRQDNMAGEVQEINQYLASFPNPRPNYRALCASGRVTIFASIDACFVHLQETAAKGSVRYQQVLAMFKANRAYVEKIMRAQHLAALLLPLNAAGGPSYHIRHVNTWRAPIASNAGLPAVTIIAGFNQQHPALPVGMELIALPEQDFQLLGMAYAYQQQAPALPLPILHTSRYADRLVNLSIYDLNNLFTLIGYKAYIQFLQHRDTLFIPAKPFGALVKQILATFKSTP